ncbi:MAG: extracellular solute-binding protein [Rhodocyclaceae bacterium]
MQQVFPIKISCAVLAAALAACATAAPKQAAKPAAKQPAQPTVVELEFVQQLGADKGEQLAKLVERFNEANPNIKVTLSDRDWTEGKQPALILPTQEGEDRLISTKRYKPLWDVMRGAGLPLKTFPVLKMVTPTPVNSKGRLEALPVALSTPVLFYNKDALAKAGLDPNNVPKTWMDWQAAMGKIYASGNTCPFTTVQPAWILIENTSAWNNQPFVSMNGKQEALAANGLIQVKHLAMMSSWYKARYLQVFGRGDEALEPFAKGACAVLTAPSDDYPTLQRMASFDIGVAPFPFHGDAYGAPQNTVADGSSLWIGAGKTAAEYKAAAKFVNFWLTPETQVEWQVNAGYLPLNTAGALATGSKLLSDKLLAQQIAIEELTNKPVSIASTASTYGRRAGVRRILDEEIESVWANKKPAKQALDDAVNRARAGEDGCCRATVRP